MKNIGLLNFHNSHHNYGAVLQAAALQEYLKSEGYKVENIDLIKDYNLKKSPVKLFLKGIKTKLSKLINPRKKFTILNKEAFEKFRNQWLTRSKDSYRSLEELNSAKLKYDTYIVGSDQVWRIRYTPVEIFPAYFLSFSPDSSKKISYAASFGVDHWEAAKDDDITSNTQKLISRFDAISVREKSGVAICADVFNTSAELVLDSTLLIGKEFFNKIIGSDTDTQKNIVHYKLILNDDFNKTLDLVSKQLNTPVENIYYNEIENSGKSKFAYNEVSTWLAKIRDSELVITDSYHCICFAILFEKPFLYYPNPHGGFARIESLFSQLSIDMKCVVSNSNEITDISTLIVNDYLPINIKLEKLRDKSKNFLIKNIEK